MKPMMMMNSQRNLVLLAIILMGLAITPLAAPTQELASGMEKKHEDSMALSRLLAETSRRRPWVMTCNQYPRVCWAKGSPGPDCCSKKCVNVSKDRLNCGMCGRKCKYSEICCRGECVNPMFDNKHCGHCHNGCKKGISCYHGMCGYA